MATFTQAKRLLTVSSPLGEDVLLLTGFSGREEISRLFKFQLDLLSLNDAIAPADIVGLPITWAVHHVDDEPRFFHGYVNRFAAAGKAAGGLRSYRADVVPWLWFLTRTADCKIFQNKSADAIIRAVFDGLGFSDYEIALTRPLRVREYCVQYRETAFNFVSRLMEEEGIFYFFKHADGKHTLVLADAKNAYADCTEDDVEYYAGSLSPNHISSWEHQYEYRPGKWTQTDYNFETPSTSLLTSTGTVVNLPSNGKYEMFDYPGLYYKTPDGKPLTKAHMEEEETPYDVVTGAGTCCTFTSAGKFTLSRHECEAEKRTYVLTGVQHTATDPSYQMNGSVASYRNTFSCIPASVQFRPARVTPKPVVQGLQTAVVVGPKGEEIFTDKYGRIKVQFFWDRQGKRDENSSVWMRVAQILAGKRWGASFWPRIGQEVVVDFLEGDPDRPLITGSVYNAEQMPPYQGNGLDAKHASDNKVMGIKSNSTPGGQGFNEWRFDDTRGKEQVFIHAERNMDVRVKNDGMEWVRGSRHLIVGTWAQNGAKTGDQKELVCQDKHLRVGRNQEEMIDGNLKLTVGYDTTLEGGNVDIAIQKDKKELIEGSSHVHVKKALNVLVDGGLSEAVGGLAQSVGGDAHLQVKGDRNVKVGGDHSVKVAGKLHELVGGSFAIEAGEIHLKAGSKIIIEAPQVSIVGAGGFVDVGAGGVTIQGAMVLINSGGSHGSGCGCSPNDPKGPARAEDAQHARPADPTEADDSKSGFKSAPGLASQE
jgi:type VI secretion system secreted protein VgrG